MSEEQFQKLMDLKLAECRILPTTSVNQIAHLCALFSTPAVEVHARIEFVNGKPVAYLTRTRRDESVPSFLKRQAS
jgi:hypothetical protein